MIILVGASASGKTEVAKLLNVLYSIKKVVTHTTRPIRKSEVMDVDYHFVSEEDFLKLKADDSFVETTFYNGNYYGSSKKEIGDNKALIVDPAGLDSFLALNNSHIVTFFLEADEKTRFERMLLRGDSIENAKSRIANDSIKFSQEIKSKVNYVIDSEHLTLLDMAQKVYELYTNHLKVI
ncbi:MAG: hypothetical protein J1F31_03405 [Erysipelotrichales bacterium]|nr:hypothetical protein [Erysipelotrichales bacterium]